MRSGVIYRGKNPIVPTAWIADRPWSRLRGLLARKPLASEAKQALWLVPCGSVHTIGMTYPIDLVFLDKSGSVIRCDQNVPPWRARFCRDAYQTVELAAGSIKHLRPTQGEVWQWRQN